MPPNHVIDVAEAMHGFLVAAPELAGRWLLAAASQHKSSVSDKALAEFVSVAIAAFARLGASVCWSGREIPACRGSVQQSGLVHRFSSASAS